MSLLGDILGGGVEIAGAFDNIDRLKDASQNAADSLAATGLAAKEGTVFRPFNISSTTGNVQVGNDGSISTSVSDPFAMAAGTALSGAETAFNDAGMSLDQRTQGIFDSALATLLPQFQRDNISLANNLFRTGRTGITSANYGGSSEQLANALAQDEAIAKAYFNSRMAAGNELNQAAQRGQGLLGSALQPEASLYNYLNPAINVANLGQTGQIAGQNLQTQADVAGIQTQANIEKIIADMYSSLYGSAANAATGLGNAITNDIQAGPNGLINQGIDYLLGYL